MIQYSRGEGKEVGHRVTQAFVLDAAMVTKTNQVPGPFSLNDLAWMTGMGINNCNMRQTVGDAVRMSYDIF